MGSYTLGFLLLSATAFVWLAVLMLMHGRPSNAGRLAVPSARSAVRG